MGCYLHWVWPKSPSSVYHRQLVNRLLQLLYSFLMSFDVKLVNLFLKHTYEKWKIIYLYTVDLPLFKILRYNLNMTRILQRIYENSSESLTFYDSWFMLFASFSLFSLGTNVYFFPKTLSECLEDEHLLQFQCVFSKSKEFSCIIRVQLLKSGNWHWYNTVI